MHEPKRLDLGVENAYYRQEEAKPVFWIRVFAKGLKAFPVGVWGTSTGPRDGGRRKAACGPTRGARGCHDERIQRPSYPLASSSHFTPQGMSSRNKGTLIRTLRQGAVPER